MKKLAFASISDLRNMLEQGEITPEQLAGYYIDRFAKYDKELNCAIEVFDKESVLTSFCPQGPLKGVPGIVKDNIAQIERGLSCASKILEGFSSTYDATAVSRLKQAGALSIGRANMDEFAMGSSTETSAFGIAKNPWDISRVPGGSSGGSAIAVAAGLVPWALGTDTGGSVRQPAAFCGVVGMKPTYGLVSRYGLVAYGSSLDQIGVFTRNVYDNALVLSAMAGHDMKDSTSLSVEKKDYTQKLDGSLKENLKIGVIENALHAEGMDPEIVNAIEEALKVWERQGAKISRITLPTLDHSAAAYFIISRAEAASNLARYDGVCYGLRREESTLDKMYSETRHDGFGAEVKTRIMVGNYVLSAGHAGDFYNNAKVVQRMIRYEFMQAFKDVDLLVMPTHPAPAFKIGAFAQNKLQMDLQDYFTCSVNLAGIPGISIPCGFSKDKLPIGMQLLGPHLAEGLIYQTAHAYQEQTDWHTRHPEGFDS